MTLDLTDEEARALAKYLRRALDETRYPLAPRLAPLKSILAKLDPPPLRPGMATQSRAGATEAMKLPSALRRPRAFWISVCNIVGLLCSMVGVVLLFWYALPVLPPAISPIGLGDGPEFERYTKNAHIGLALVLIGTLLEVVPPFCTAVGSWRRGSGERQK